MSKFKYFVSMGFLRFFLSLIVASMHAGVVSGVNFAAMSVLIFYVVSGYAIAGLYNSHFLKKTKLQFYADRILRLFPIYLVCVVLSMSVLIAHPRVHLLFHKIALANNIFPIFLNILGPVPERFFRVVDDGNNFLLPQSWSLASEMQFYLLLPFLISLRSASRQFFDLLFLFSFLIFTLGILGILTTEFYSYRFSAGTLFFFMSGIKLFFNEWTNARKIWRFTCFVLFPICLILQRFEVPFALESILGVMIGFPLVRHVSTLNIKSRRDEFLGAASYPVYLSHFAFIWLFEYSLLKQLGPITKGVSILILTLAVSAGMVVFIERPLQKFRRGLRETTDLKT